MEIPDNLLERLVVALERSNDINDALLSEFRTSNGMNAKPNDRVLSISEVARRTGKTRQTISRKIRQNIFTRVVVGGKCGILESELYKIRKPAP